MLNVSIFERTLVIFLTLGKISHFSGENEKASSTPIPEILENPIRVDQVMPTEKRVKRSPQTLILKEKNISAEN